MTEEPPAIIERVLAILREREDAVPEEDLAREVLRLAGGADTVAAAILRRMLEDDPRLRRSSDGLWSAVDDGVPPGGPVVAAVWVHLVGAGSRLERPLAIGLPLWAIWSVYGGALRGSGDTRSPMISNVTSTWTAVALAYLAVTLLGGGLGAVWLAFFLPTPVAAWFSRWRFTRRLRTGDIAPAASLPRG